MTASAPKQTDRVPHLAWNSSKSPFCFRWPALRLVCHPHGLKHFLCNTAIWKGSQGRALVAVDRQARPRSFATSRSVRSVEVSRKSLWSMPGGGDGFLCPFSAVAYHHLHSDEHMLQAGLAEVYQGGGAVYGPRGKDAYLEMQQTARQEKVGIWSQGRKRESAAAYKART